MRNLYCYYCLDLTLCYTDQKPNKMKTRIFCAQYYEAITIIKILNLYIILLCTHLYNTYFQYLSSTCNAFVACYNRRRKNAVESPVFFITESTPMFTSVFQDRYFLISPLSFS